MIKSLSRMFGMYKKYRARLVVSQVLVLISATAIIGVASLNQRLSEATPMMASKPRTRMSS